MNRMKNLIAAIVIIMCFGSVNVYATKTWKENELPPLPLFTEDEKNEALDNNQTDNSTSNSTNDSTNSGSNNSSGGSGGSYRPSTKPTDKTEPNQDSGQQEPMQTENDSKTFSDIKQDDWFYSDVMFVFQNKIMAGISEREFSPNTTLNRAMMITILHRIDGDATVSEKNIFHDVENNSWYENAVNWGYEKKIILGISENTFAPMVHLTREQLCVMLYNYIKHIGLKPEFADISSYADNNTVSDWAKDAVCWAVQEKIITGKGNNTLAPKDSATRAEAAAVIRRYIEKFVEIEE